MKLGDILDATDTLRAIFPIERESDGRQHFQITGGPRACQILYAHRDHKRPAGPQRSAQSEQQRMTALIPREPFNVQPTFVGNECSRRADVRRMSYEPVTEIRNIFSR